MKKTDLQKIRDALAYYSNNAESDALAILDRALAAPEQEPFAWATFDGEGSYDLRLYECNENYRDDYLKRNGDKYAGWVEPLYRHPAPSREWQGLTDEEIMLFFYRIQGPRQFARAIEAALRAKNSGEQA